MKIKPSVSLADTLCDARTKRVRRTFLKHIHTLLDWEAISKILSEHYRKGNGRVGRASHDGLLLFKMCLLQTWYGLSDYEVEDSVNDSISFSYFCGLRIDSVAPDHSTVSRFRSALTKAGAYEFLLKEINRQLEAHHILVKSGAIVDASVIETPLKPKRKKARKNTEHTQKLPVKNTYADSLRQRCRLAKEGK